MTPNFTPIFQKKKQQQYGYFMFSPQSRLSHIRTYYERKRSDLPKIQCLQVENLARVHYCLMVIFVAEKLWLVCVLVILTINPARLGKARQGKALWC
jgi:hypothetical protein